MKIEKPISESQIPPAPKSKHYKHLAIYTAVMKLPDGKVLPVVCDTPEQAKKFGTSVIHSSFAPIRAFVREKTVYLRLRNEKDEAERKHIEKLRELARAKKAGTAEVSGAAK